MSDALLPYYERELAAIRRLAGEFAAANPKIAGRLQMTPDTVADPHVERLLEGVASSPPACSTGWTTTCGTDGCAAGTALPASARPVPSLATLRFTRARPAARPRGARHGVETEEVRGERLTYRTCQDTVLWPVANRAGAAVRPALPAPPNPHAPAPSACCAWRSPPPSPA